MQIVFLFISLKKKKTAVVGQQISSDPKKEKNISWSQGFLIRFAFHHRLRAVCWVTNESSIFSLLKIPLMREYTELYLLTTCCIRNQCNFELIHWKSWTFLNFSLFLIFSSRDWHIYGRIYRRPQVVTYWGRLFNSTTRKSRITVWISLYRRIYTSCHN